MFDCSAADRWANVFYFCFVFCSSQKEAVEYKSQVNVKSIFGIKCVCSKVLLCKIWPCVFTALYKALLARVKILLSNVSLSPFLLYLKNAV